MGIKVKLIDYFKGHPKSLFTTLFCWFYTLLGRNRFKGIGRNNVLVMKSCFLKRCRITIEGEGNLIDLSGGGLNNLSDTVIYIHGNNNTIRMGYRNNIEHGDFYIEDDDNLICFGDHSQLMGRTHVAVIEGTSVIFGSDCMFSNDVVFRTGDSHSILDNTSKKRINPSKSIHVGDHVWFGNKTTILKGCEIASDVIIGTGAIVTKSVLTPNVIVAGSPARVIKTGTNWDMHRIPIENGNSFYL